MRQTMPRMPRDRRHSSCAARKVCVSLGADVPIELPSSLIAVVYVRKVVLPVVMTCEIENVRSRRDVVVRVSDGIDLCIRSFDTMQCVKLGRKCQEIGNTAAVQHAKCVRHPERMYGSNSRRLLSQSHMYVKWC